MTSTTHQDFVGKLRTLAAKDAAYATQFVEALLAAAREVGASDVHLQPAADGLEVAWRIDGVLQQLGCFPRGQGSDVVARMKVLAELLTYRTDIPQEGRIRHNQPGVEMRVSTFPTLHGERAVVRLFSASGQFLHVADLGLPPEVEQRLQQLLAETSGTVLITGPAGSGKTTTLYACLRELVRGAAGRKSIVTLEDPIEVAVAGVAQSQVQPVAGFDLATGLRSVLRQDPEVVMVGEIRDRATAEGVFGAALTGHLVLTTFHAGSAAGAISRLSDMGIEPYLLRSGILAVISQRLLRRLCDCSREATDSADRLGLPVRRVRLPAGCPQCLNTGYRGRLVIAEMLLPQPNEVGRAILSREDASQLEQRAIAAGMMTRWQRAAVAVEAGHTSPAEVRRVLGFSGDSAADTNREPRAAALLPSDPQTAHDSN